MAALAPVQARRLRIGNAALALLHLGQAVVILLLANDFTLPVTGTFLDAQPGSPLPPADTLVDVPIGPLVAAFLLLAALDHGLVAAPGVNAWYTRSLANGANPARWLEYSVSASLMVALIAMLTGVADVGALVAIIGVNAAMILFGWLMERANRTREDVDWLPFAFGCVAGAVPWIVITISIAGSVAGGRGRPASSTASSRRCWCCSSASR